MATISIFNFYFLIFDFIDVDSVVYMYIYMMYVS